MVNEIKKILRPVVRCCRQKRIAHLASKTSAHYKRLVESIRQSGKTKLSFAAYVVFDSTFGMDGVFRLMMNDAEHWDPKIVVIPDISRGDEHKENTYIKTKNFFIKKYGREYVLDGWNKNTDTYYDYLSEFDLVYYANPYDIMVHEYHKIVYASTKNVLPVYVSYGYDIGRLTTLDRIRNPELNLVWKLFADTTYMYEDYVKDQIVKGKNVVLAGYSKMDNFNDCIVTQHKRKKILITPHHTVVSKELPLSNFLKYSELILELPLMFPDIDFVFRPHPLLFTMLINENLWTHEKIDQYIAALKARGVEYSTEGDYLPLFSECDAIINDCGSFTVEWLYTGKPGCFVYKDELNEGLLTTLMNKAISAYTVARSRDDIIEFVERISEDTGEHNYEMEAWVKENIAINYPDVSSFLLKEMNILM